MVLLQLTATYNSLFSSSRQISNTTIIVPVTAGFINRVPSPRLLYNVNLNRGTYKARVVGVKIACGFPQTSAGTNLQRCNPMLFGIESPSFRFPPSQDNIFWFSSNSQYSLGNVTGDKTFIIDNPTGNIELELRVVMFGSYTGFQQSQVPFFTNNASWTWADTLFSNLMLTIDVEPMDIPDNDILCQVGF